MTSRAGRFGNTSSSTGDDASAPRSFWQFHLTQFFTVIVPLAFFLYSVFADDYYVIKTAGKTHYVGFFNIGRTYKTSDDSYSFTFNRIGDIALIFYAVAVIALLSIIIAYAVAIVASHFDAIQIRWFNFTHNFIYTMIVVCFVVLGKTINVTSSVASSEFDTGAGPNNFVKLHILAASAEPDKMEYGLSAMFMFSILGVIFLAHIAHRLIKPTLDDTRPKQT